VSGDFTEPRRASLAAPYRTDFGIVSPIHRLARYVPSIRAVQQTSKTRRSKSGPEHESKNPKSRPDGGSLDHRIAGDRPVDSLCGADQRRGGLRGPRLSAPLGGAPSPEGRSRSIMFRARGSMSPSQAPGSKFVTSSTSTSRARTTQTATCCRPRPTHRISPSRSVPASPPTPSAVRTRTVGPDDVPLPPLPPQPPPASRRRTRRTGAPGSRVGA